MKTPHIITLFSVVVCFLCFNSCSKIQEDPPVASFSISAVNARIGDSICFQNTSVGADQFEWDFGDGGTSTEENPCHIYSDKGDYSILLKVTNNSGSNESSHHIQISSWSSLSPMPTERGLSSSSIIDGKIFVIGGARSYADESLNTHEVYDPETDTWSVRSEIPTARQIFTTSVVDGKIYAIGGCQVSGGDYHYLEALTSVEVYDPLTDSWYSKSPMPSARFNHSAVVYEGKIYIIGGADVFPFNAFYTMVIYDPVTDTWSSEINIPRAVVSSTAINLDGKIYIIGGDLEDNHNRLDVYNPVTNTWTQKADMPTKRDDLSCCVLDGKIYAIGGEAETYEALNIVEVYDPSTNSWTEEDPLLQKRWTHNSCMLNNKIFVIGGLSEYRPFVKWVGLSDVEVFY